MGNLYFGTSKLAIVALLAMTFFAGSVPTLSAQTTLSHSASLNDPGPDAAIYCGAASSYLGLGWDAYPYTLRVSATAGTRGGRFRITFRDRDSMGFEVPGTGNRMNDTTHALGGISGVDDVVKITAEDIQNITAKVEVSYDINRPFDPFTQSENFCITAGEPGTTSARRIIP